MFCNERRSILLMPSVSYSQPDLPIYPWSLEVIGQTNWLSRVKRETIPRKVAVEGNGDSENDSIFTLNKSRWFVSVSLSSVRSPSAIVFRFYDGEGYAFGPIKIPKDSAASLSISQTFVSPRGIFSSTLWIFFTVSSFSLDRFFLPRETQISASSDPDKWKRTPLTAWPSPVPHAAGRGTSFSENGLIFFTYQSINQSHTHTHKIKIRNILFEGKIYKGVYIWRYCRSSTVSSPHRISEKEAK